MYDRYDTETLIFLAKCWEERDEIDYVEHYKIVVELNSRGVYEW